MITKRMRLRGGLARDVYTLRNTIYVFIFIGIFLIFWIAIVEIPSLRENTKKTLEDCQVEILRLKEKSQNYETRISKLEKEINIIKQKERNKWEILLLDSL